MIIRSYEPTDIDAVWQLHNEALQASGVHLDNGPWDKDLKSIPEIYLQNQGCFLVGLENGHIVAMGALRRTDSTRAEIKRMRVHPDFQQRGYGTTLLKALEAEANRLGYKALHLDTTTVQIAAQKLYETHGYQKVGTGTVGKFDTLLYEKILVRLKV